MTMQIKPLIKLELTNIFGINVLLHTKDKKEKRVKTLLAGILVFLVIMLAGYMGALCYGLIRLGMADIVFAYLTVWTSVLIFIFNLFKAGNLIFQKNGYEIISSLPLSQTAVVCSRFARMYVESMILTAIVFLTGTVVYGWREGPGWTFYVMVIAGMLFVPLLPMSVSVLIGALIKAVSSRMKHKSFVEIFFMLALVLGMLVLSYGLGGAGTGLVEQALKELPAEIYALLEKIYPPAIWFAGALSQSRAGKWLLFAAVSLAFALAAVGISAFRFHAICRGLFGTSARHDYQMQAQSQNSLLVSLCKRELKRYVSSGTYVTNTIIGPILGTALSVVILIKGIPAAVFDELPVNLNVYGAVPFLLAMIFCMMNPSCVSISMEGKSWWIVKSLPIEAGLLLDAKLLAGLIVYAPFYLVSEVLLLIALKPGMAQAFWLIVVPMLFLVFGAVFGITVNLRFPLFGCEDEVRIVKQSASALIGGLGAALIGFVCLVAAAFVPTEYAAAVKAGICALILLATILLHRKNAAVRLELLG